MTLRNHKAVAKPAHLTLVAAEPEPARLPYTYRTGGKYWRFRHPHVGDVKLPGAFGDDAFHVRYGELVKVAMRRAAADATGVDVTSMKWLFEQWFESPDFQMLAASTQRHYRRSANVAAAPLHDEPYRLMTRAMVRAVRDSHANMPAKAKHFVAAVSSCFNWAQQVGHVEDGDNPALRITKLKHRPKNHLPWSDAEIELLLAVAPPGLATVILLGAYTGQRGSDCVAMDWSRVLGAEIRVKQQKTGLDLTIPCHPRLRAHLDVLLSNGGGQGVIARREDGKPFSMGAYREELNALKALFPGLAHCRPHGLRYTAAAKLTEAGCSVAQISAIIGHTTFQNAMRYIEQMRLAGEAMELLLAHEAKVRAIVASRVKI